jgi:hypothetical protein
MSALLQITMETEETTERDKAPTVPSWKRSPSPIFAQLPKKNKSRKWIKKHMNYIEKQNQRKTQKTKSEIYLEREREREREK